MKIEASSDDNGSQRQHDPSKPGTSVIKLMPGAREIFPSRSNTETAIYLSRPKVANLFTHMTNSSIGSNPSINKPPLIQKKSGELVQPALRPFSRRQYKQMPGTLADFRSVHFNDFDNQTRYFFQTDSTMDILPVLSPVETCDSRVAQRFGNNDKATRGIKIANLPHDSSERKSKPVQLERLFLSSDRDTLVGTVVVQNMSFQKLVVAHFTLDCWKTTSELVAQYAKDIQGLSSAGYDRFTFRMELSDIADIDKKSLLLCVRYNVNGKDHWDNNNSMDYNIEFIENCGGVHEANT
jgi:hypothetical protein